MRKHLIFINLLVAFGLSSIFPDNVIAQEMWSMDQFLLSSMDHPVHVFQEKKIQDMTSSPSLPIIERLEFRTETRDFDLEKQRYSLRLATNSYRSILENKDDQNYELALNKIHQDILIENELINRYQMIISYVFLRDKIALLEEEKTLFNSKMDILKKMASWDDLNIKEIIETEEDLLRNDLSLTELNHTLSSLHNKLFASTGTNISLNTEDIIAARFIKDHYLKILNLEDSNNRELESLDIELQQIESKKNIERHKSNKLVKFYEFGYNSSPNPFEQGQLSLGIGMILPFKGSNVLDEHELILDELELKSDRESILYEFKLKKYDILNDLQNSLNRFEILTKHEDASLAARTLVKYTEFPNISSLAILSLQEHHLSKKSKLIEVEFDVYKNYIESLEVYGLLDIEPFQNFLSINHFGY